MRWLCKPLITGLASWVPDDKTLIPGTASNCRAMGVPECSNRRNGSSRWRSGVVVFFSARTSTVWSCNFWMLSVDGAPLEEPSRNGPVGETKTKSTVNKCNIVANIKITLCFHRYFLNFGRHSQPSHVPFRFLSSIFFYQSSHF